MKRHMYLLTAMVVLTGGVARAQAPAMDGTKDAAYGAALSIQNTNTQFGNGTTGDTINAGGGSEIDGVYATVSGGRLYVLVTGNLETNFNKLEVLIDSEAGAGVNSIVGADLPRGVDRFCCGGFTPPDGNNTDNVGALQRMNGLTFDAGFNADHYLSFTHGFESALSPNLTFYASSAYYADLTAGAAGPSGPLGIQLAQKGLPRVLRGTTSDVDVDGDADGRDYLRIQENYGATGVNRLSGDASGNGSVGDEDVTQWASSFGFTNTAATFGANYFAPQSAGIDNSNSLLGPTLPGLTQGQLIDKTYALAPGPGGATDNAGTNAVTRELEFVLPIVTPGTGNPEGHRDMVNNVGLQMAFDNSNVAGVTGAGPYTDPTLEDTAAVSTGIEFSIPLASIGYTAGDIKLLMFVNGGGHDYASNQFSGAGILDGNLGGNGTGGFTGDLAGVNMLDFAGDQFVTLDLTPVGAVPEPASAALAVGAALVLAARRRRR
jgi:hypothetical protein